MDDEITYGSDELYSEVNYLDEENRK